MAKFTRRNTTCSPARHKRAALLVPGPTRSVCRPIAVFRGDYSSRPRATCGGCGLRDHGLSLHEQLNAGSSVRAWLLAKGFVLNTCEAVESAGNLGITAITHGMVCAIEASDFPVMVQQSAYLASTDDVQLNADQSRLNPVVSASKWIHCSGTGELWLNAQGLWEMVEVDGCYRINSRYLMAYSKALTLKRRPWRV